MKTARPKAGIPTNENRMAVEPLTSRMKMARITKAIKALGLKVQATLQDRQVRVTGSKKDDLQKVIGSLRTADFGVGLDFKNFRD